MYILYMYVPVCCYKVTKFVVRNVIVQTFFRIVSAVTIL